MDHHAVNELRNYKHHQVQSSLVKNNNSKVGLIKQEYAASKDTRSVKPGRYNKPRTSASEPSES